MKSKIFITGSRGFIGNQLSRRLRNSEAFVVTDDDIQGKKNVDITNINKLGQLVEKGIDIIVHLAAKTSVIDAINHPYVAYYTNLVGTLNVLELARIRDIRKVVFLSTYVYGHPRYLPIDESHVPNPHTPYNQSKLMAERLCENYSRDYAIDIVTLRPFLIYGPNPTSHSFIGSVIRQIRENGRVLLSGDNTRRDFLFIDDFVDLLVLILCHFPHRYSLYNVGFGKSYSLREVSQLLATLMEKKIVINYDNQMRLNDITDIVADISKVSAAFNWNPHTSLKNGLESCIKLIYNA